MKMLTALTAFAMLPLAACTGNPAANARSVEAYYADAELRAETLSACVAHSVDELRTNSAKPACMNAREAAKRHEEEATAAYEADFNRRLEARMKAGRKAS